MGSTLCPDETPVLSQKFENTFYIDNWTSRRFRLGLTVNNWYQMSVCVHRGKGCAVISVGDTF